MNEESVVDALFDREAIGKEVKDIKDMLVGLHDDVKKSILEMIRVYKEELKTVAEFDFKGLQNGLEKVRAESKKTEEIGQQRLALWVYILPTFPSF